MKPNFRIVEESSDFWDKYEEFVKLWNNGKYTVKEIREMLGLSPSKYYQYRDKGFSENLLDGDLRSPRESSKRGYRKKLCGKGTL